MIMILLFFYMWIDQVPVSEGVKGGLGLNAHHLI